MELTELVKLIVDNGVTIIVISYFMFRDYKFQNTLVTTLQTLVDTVDTLKEMIKKEE